MKFAIVILLLTCLGACDNVRIGADNQHPQCPFRPGVAYAEPQIHVDF